MFDLALRYIARTRQPILCGPWTSEMGFETLYWLPYLEHLKATYQIDPARLIVVTRGGAGIWYNAGKSVELFDYVPPADLRLQALAGSKSQQSIKQLGVTRYERKLLALIAERLGLRRYHVIHPSRMYRALDRFWGEQTMGFADAVKLLRFTPLVTPPTPVGLSLPEQFVAVRWYARPTWPLNESLLEWTQQMVLSMAEKMPVVVLKSAAYLDDHVDFPAPTGPNITTITAEPWRENLAVQSAIIKKAAAFIGTWGGMAQLAVRLGIPTAAFYEKWHSCSYAHKVLTEWLAVAQGTPLFVGRPQDAEFGRAVYPKELSLPEAPRGSSS
jgi:hypothetical protein